MESIILDFDQIQPDQDPYKWLADAFDMKYDHPGRMELLLIHYPFNRKVVLKNWQKHQDVFQDVISYLESIQQHSQNFFLIYEPVNEGMY